MDDQHHRQKTRHDDRKPREHNQEGRDKKSFAQKSKRDMICYCCGKKGHGSDECYSKEKIPREEWYIKKAVLSKSENRGTGDDERKSEKKPSGEKKKAWSGFQYWESDSEQCHSVRKYEEDPSDDLRDVFILDTGSTIGATIMNPKMMSNIKPVAKPLIMVTNAGSKKLLKKGDINGFGEAWYDPDQVANIFGFAKLEDQYRITYDSSVEKAFNVHTNDGIVKFERNTDGLYTYRPSKEYLKDVAAETTDDEAANYAKPSFFIETVQENKKGYTQRQFEDAKQARKLYHIIGCPTTENFKALLRQNIIKNCPVTVEDVNIAERIFGPDIGTLKGKSTRTKPIPVKSDLIEIPPELKKLHKNLTLCMDIMFVNGMPMLTGIDRSIRFRALIALDSRSESEIFRGITSIFRLYENAGFRIKRIHCDQEFRNMMERVSTEFDITMNYATAGEHVPEAERNNRTIQERIRATYHNLPYAMIPKVMLRYLAMICTQQLNYFPVKGGISPYYSPHVILTGKAIDYNKHCQIPFGAYVQANNEPNPTNTNAPRTIDCIYLRPFPNIQGGHELMDLKTGRVITRRRVTEIPVTELVIQAVENMAHEQGLTTLKITGRHTSSLYPADWIAGVDYTENGNQDEDYIDDEEEMIEAEIDNQELYDRIDPEEIADLTSVRNEGEEENQEIEEHEPDPVLQEEIEIPGEPEGPEQVEEEVPQQEVPDGEAEEVKTTRSGRVVTKPTRFIEQDHMILHQTSKNDDRYIEYSDDIAIVAARTIDSMNYEVSQKGAAFAQQYILQKGMKKFGERGKQAASDELDQLHKRNCFNPVDVSTMTSSEKKKAMESLLFLTEKRDGRIKARMVYNGKPTRQWLGKEESAAPTASLESIMLTAIIDAKENRDVMSADIPNAFIQANMPETKNDEERVIMKITGMLVDLLVEIDPARYGPYVVYENGNKTIYVEVLRALYGMLIAALLWYRQFKTDLEKAGFKFNSYDPCIANRRVNGSMQTVKFHVDDLKSSHIDPKVNDHFLAWLNSKYGKHGAVKATRGKVHDYLGMTFTYSDDGVTIDMREYIKAMIDEFPYEIGERTSPTPANDDLFTIKDSPNLDKIQSEELHTFVAKSLFACKRARPDLHTTTTFLCTRVKQPTQDDWTKLLRLMTYLNGSKDEVLFLSADDLHVIKWYVDASFAVHKDFKSHTGGAMSYGTGVPISISRKQKLNTRSSTEAELVAVDDVSNLILWTKLFLDEQGYRISRNVIHQDNKSAILLERNGKRSSSKRTRAINIRYFFIADQVEQGNVEICYCPTNMMIGDFFTKPLQGKKFEYFRDLILGKKSISTLEIVDRSVLEEERILQAKTTDAEQTNMQPQDETDETNDMLSVLR
jgi:hypothetical protein